MMNRFSWIVVLALSACGPATHRDDAGGMADAGAESDAGVTADSGIPMDAGRPDAAGIRDGGAPDSGHPDAGLSDGGIAQDATAPPDSGPTEDAGSAIECSDGEFRTAPCGSCGLESQECVDARWTSVSACLGHGVCAPASVDSESLAMCEVRQRICTSTCEWTGWTTVEPPGVCEVDEVRTLEGAGCGTGLVAEVCDASCAWAADGCRDGCGDTGRTSPAWSEEVCVRAGGYIRGVDDGNEPHSPEREIHLSSYYIDRYPVTQRRFSLCIDAGACQAPDVPEFEYAPDGRVPLPDIPVRGLPWARAHQFCVWDGGRDLPTESQWEKAIRGPAPRRNIFPWDGTAYLCDQVPAGGCPPPFQPSSWQGRFIYDYDGLPGSRGYYGTELQLGNGVEWVLSRYHPDWYRNSDSYADDEAGSPTGSPVNSRVLRGAEYSQTTQSSFLYLRNQRTASNGGDSLRGTFRCARPAQ